MIINIILGLLILIGFLIGIGLSIVITLNYNGIDKQLNSFLKRYKK